MISASMHHATKIVSKFGYIDVYTNEDKSKLLAVPNGYISPSLVKHDLEFLLNFDASTKAEWQYIVDISNVTAINPINPFLLRKLKQCSNMTEYIVYAPSPVVRLMLSLSSWINKPDRIIKSLSLLPQELK